MRMKRTALILVVALVTTLPARESKAFFAEIGPLLQLVAGQVEELARLAETVKLAQENQELLTTINEGINKAVGQIQTLQAIIERTQGMDPSAVRSLAELNGLLSDAKRTQEDIEQMMSVKYRLTNQAISQSALQSDTAYKMGQEMASVGSLLAAESRTASPGRAAQLTAASTSAQMLASGVELQTLSQMVQLQALSLEFQKLQFEREVFANRGRRPAVSRELMGAMLKGRK